MNLLHYSYIKGYKLRSFMLVQNFKHLSNHYKTKTENMLERSWTILFYVIKLNDQMLFSLQEFLDLLSIFGYTLSCCILNKLPYFYQDFVGVYFLL